MLNSQILKCGIGLAALVIFVTAEQAPACTSIVVGKDASASGNPVFARNEDFSETNANPKRFVVYPAGFYKAGDTYKDNATPFNYTFQNDSLKYTGTPDAVVNGDGRYDAGGVNAYGLALSATNTTHISEKAQAADPLNTYESGGIREAHIATLVLGQAKTAREGVELLGGMVEEYGNSETYIVILGDAKEIWLFQALSGRHWVAARVPDDCFATFANDMAVDFADLSDKANYLGSGYEKFAYDKGFAVEDEAGFHIARTFNEPLNQPQNTFRHWIGYDIFAPSQNVRFTTSPDRVYPLFVKPDKKIAVEEIMLWARNRFEGTFADISLSPYPYDNDPVPVGRTYQLHTHIYEPVSGYPPEIGARFWLSFGQGEHSVFLPFYGLIQDTHPYYQTEVKNAEIPQDDSAYWVFSGLCALARENRTLYGKPVRDYWRAYELDLLEKQTAVEKEMLARYAKNPDDAARWITALTIAGSGEAMQTAKKITQALEQHIEASPDKLFAVPK